MNDKNTPIVGEEDLKELKSMLGDVDDLVQDDLSFDEIMMEFGASQKKETDKNSPAASAPSAAPTAEEKKVPVVSVADEEFEELDEIASIPETDSVSMRNNETSDSAALADTAPIPRVETVASQQTPITPPVNHQKDAELLQKHISDQVKNVMNKKQAQNTGVSIPKSVAENSAVKVTEEFEAQDEKKVKKVSGRAKTVRENAATEENYGYDISDDLKTFQRLMPAAAAEKAKGAVGFYRWRCIVTALLSLVAAYITAAPTYKWPLPGFISYMEMPYIYLMILAFIQIAAMMVSISLVVDGLRNIPKFNFKSETLIAVFNFMTLFHTISIILFPNWGGYLPYTGIAILSLFFGELARFMRYDAVRHAMRAIARKDSKYAVIKGMKDGGGKVRTVYKTAPSALEKMVMNMIMEEDGSERIMRFYVPFVLVLGFIFAITASFGIGSFHRFLWCYSAVLAVSIPAGAILSYVYPFLNVSARLAASGAVVAGNRGARYLYDAGAAVVKDSDVFPTKMVAVISAKTYGGFTPEKTNLYAMSMLKASGSGLYDVFCNYLHRMDGGGLPVVENFEFFENGGIGAYVNGEKVLLGSASFIMRSGIRIPEGVNAKSSIFLAINMQLAGHFTLKYDSQPSVRRALHYFVRRKVVPVVATRDFNISPSMIENKFKLEQDKFGYPELEERIAYSGLKDAPEDEICAAIAVDNMNSYSDVMSGGKRIQAAYKVNVALGWISVILGMPIVFYLLFTNSPASVTPFYLFCYVLLWFIPTVFTSIAANRR